MTYTLRRASADQHELLLRGTRIGRMERASAIHGQRRCWRVVLDDATEPDAPPPPFIASVHTFATAAVWLALQLGSATRRPG